MFVLFITIVFIHSITGQNDKDSSLIILGYANSNDSTIDIIELIKEEKKHIDQLCFYLNDSLIIDNNIFNYIFNGTIIIDYSEEIKLFLDDKPIEKNFILPKDECIKIYFPNENGIFRKSIYNIEFAYIVKE